MSPDQSLIVILAGIFLIYAEFNLPGKIIFGAAGALTLMLGVHSLLRYPLHAWLILPALALTILELRSPTRGIFATALLAWALSRLVPGQNAAPRVHLVTAILLAAVFNAVTIALGRIALLARRNKARGSSHWGNLTLEPPPTHAQSRLDKVREFVPDDHSNSPDRHRRSHSPRRRSIRLGPVRVHQDRNPL